MNNTVLRELSPLTGNPGRIVFETSYTSPEMINFLSKYYTDTKGKSLIDTALLPDKYTILYDRESKFFWQKEILNDKGMFELYEHWIDKEKSLRKRENNKLEYHYKIIKKIKKCIELVNLNPNKIVFIDIGMGWGNFCVAAKALGIKDVTGIEVSDSRIEYARRNGIQTIKDTKLIRGNSVDILTSHHCLEHLSNPMEAIEEYFRILKTGGLLRLQLPTMRFYKKQSFINNGFRVLLFLKQNHRWI